MMEMKIKIEVPDLAAAICKLAAAITPPNPDMLTPDEPVGYPAPPAVSAPAPQPVAAPVMPTAPAAPVNPTPAPVAPGPVPVAGQPVLSAPAPTNTAPAAPVAPVAPAPAVPVTAPTYTLDQISRAGAALVDAGKMDALLGLLAKFGVAAVTQLQPDQFGVFATELRALGAQI